MNKTVVALILAGMSCGMATNAFADDASPVGATTDLTVKGVLTIGSCTPNFDNGGIVDLGKIPVSTLSTAANTVTNMPEQSQNLSITCDSATQVAFNVTDNNDGSESNAGTAADVTDYGLGYLTDGTTPIGYYSIKVGDATTIDGASGQMSQSTDGGKTWSSSAADVSLSADTTDYTFTNGTDGTAPVAGTSFVMPFTVKANIDDSNSRLNSLITDDTPFSASSTFSIVYL